MGRRCLQTFQTLCTHLPATGRVLVRGGGSLKTCLFNRWEELVAGKTSKALEYKSMVIAGREGRAVGNLKLCSRGGSTAPSERTRTR